jgi:SAM-dependent methyltransferase
VPNDAAIAASPAVPGDGIERRNAEFWDELCGTALARELGLTGRDRQTLERFDRAYFEFYPYLLDYVNRFVLADRRVLEIGLGYGSLGEAIASRGAEYHGLDIAAGPVRMMRHRLAMIGLPAEERVSLGSAAALPFPDRSFDFVYSIGCLHHTGALSRSVEEVRRVLAPGGTAVVMVYNADSARRTWHVGLPSVLPLLFGPRPSDSAVAALYDRNAVGDVAPYTEFVSRRQAAQLFSAFSTCSIDTRNFDDIRIRGRVIVPRRRILGSVLERRLGLDLYIVARR